MLRTAICFIMFGVLSSCTKPMTTAGTEYVFRVNELIATLPYDLSATYAAAERIVQDDMRWSVESSSLGSTNGRIRARGAGDRTRRISMVSVGSERTEVRIEINDGPFGNADRSREVMERLEARLAGG